MADPVVIVGMGEMGGAFARGFLRGGYGVFPVTRDTDATELAGQVPGPRVAVVAVGESDLESVLHSLPAPWRGVATLIQNELLPDVWERHQLADPTIAVVWFEKKPGRPIVVIRPTVVGGPQADLVADALGHIDVPAEIAPDRTSLENALVVKNLYILTANIAGLRAGGTVGELWENHRDLAEGVARDVLAIQSRRLGRELDEEALFAEMAAAFGDDPDHGATGRSAPERLRRAIGQAEELGVAVPHLRDIAADH